jgi:plastocyanin
LLAVGLVTASLVALAIAAFAAIALTAGVNETPEPEPIFFDSTEIEVDIRDFHYIVAVISVPAGATITWTNYDAAPHTATERDGRSWDTGILQRDDAEAVTFDAPGTYHYICTLHPHMHGEITVRPLASG